MLCSSCNKKNAEINLHHLNHICSYCFVRVIEKRVRKYVRTNQLFKKGDRILVIDDLSYHLLSKMIRGLPVKVFKRGFSLNKIVTSNKSVTLYLKENKINKVILPWTLDDEINLYLEIVIFNRDRLNLRDINRNASDSTTQSEQAQEYAANLSLHKTAFLRLQIGFDTRSRSAGYMTQFVINKKGIIKMFINVTDSEIELFSKIKKIRFRTNKKNKLIRRMLNNLENKYPEIRFNSLKFIRNLYL